jgi:hypothetical protein
LTLTGITVEPLGRQHDRTAFHCGAEALDRYLKQQARQDADKRVAAPFVAVSPPNARVLGYYTLSASVLTLTELPDELARKLPRYPQLPVTLLGRLAVDQSTGNVAISWYDARNDTGVGGDAVVNTDVQYFAAISRDFGLTWDLNLQVSDGSSNTTSR